MTDWIELMLGEYGDEAENEERPALDGAAERHAALPRPETVCEPEEEPEPAPEGWADGETDALETAYRAEAGEPAELPEPEWPVYCPWDEEPEERTVPPRRLEAAVREAGDVKLTTGAAGQMAGRLASQTAAAEQAGTGSRGLAELYRQTAQAVRPATPAVTPAQAGSRVLEREDAGGPPLTAEELDRAVRRDSRRYDGGMSIF